MPSRRVIDLDIRLQAKAMLFATKMAENGVPFIFTRTKATAEEQAELYKIGRRGIPGERAVTWTMQSKHLLGLAFDIAVCKSGIPQWSEKVDVDEDGVPDYFEAGQIGESIGLKWGGRFKDAKGKPQPDFPHFEFKETLWT